MFMDEAAPLGPSARPRQPGSAVEEDPKRSPGFHQSFHILAGSHPAMDLTASGSTWIPGPMVVEMAMPRT